MSAYTINGTPLQTPYVLGGDARDQAYDIGGNELYAEHEPVTLKVMSYNCRWFRDYNSQESMQRLIFNNNDADLIGFQEFSTDGAVPAVGANVLGAYSTLRLSNHKNYLAMASKAIALTDFVIADFQNQDPKDASQYNETRAYTKCYFYAGGKRVCWLNTHLAYLTTEYKYLQMREIFDMAQQEQRVIITGDFNSFNNDTADSEYLNMYKQYVDAGYNLANNSPESGVTNTYTSATSVSGLSDLTDPPDSIIVSSNIRITNVVFDTTKLQSQYYDGTSIDHIPVIATLLI